METKESSQYHEGSTRIHSIFLFSSALTHGFLLLFTAKSLHRFPTMPEGPAWLDLRDIVLCHDVTLEYPKYPQIAFVARLFDAALRDAAVASATPLLRHAI